MSEDAPALLVPAAELWQWAQAVTTIGTLVARLRGRRAQDGRLAFADDRHAALQHEARQHPPARLMTSDELSEWSRRVPAVVRGQQHAEPFTVWAAQLADSAGRLTGQWGLEAHTWADGVETSSVRVVCRDAADVLALTRHLRGHPTVDALRRVHELAVHGDRLARVPAAEPAVRAVGTSGASEPGVAAGASTAGAAPVLSEDEWAAVLRAQLPAEVAKRVIVTDPAHPHHTAWRELYALACEEVARVGADPERLAMLVAQGPRWRAGVRNPPALAHWTITEARTSPGYPQVITTDPTAVMVASAMAAPATMPTGSAVLRLSQVRHPGQALDWAAGLRAGDAEHRLEAKLGFGRWGTQVDTVLERTFPGLVDATKSAAKRHQPRTAASAAEPAMELADSVIKQEVERALVPMEAAALAGFVAEVDRLDPDKAIDRRAAHIMLGRVHPEVDRRIATVFAADPQIEAKLDALYPDGLPDPDRDAAEHRSLAQDHEAAAAAAQAIPDDPTTPHRDDMPQVVAGERSLAARHQVLAAAAASQPQPGVRHTR